MRKVQSKEDEDMITEYDAVKRQLQVEREQRLRNLLKRVEELPLSLQLSIQGEINSLANDPSQFVRSL